MEQMIYFTETNLCVINIKTFIRFLSLCAYIYNPDQSV